MIDIHTHVLPHIDDGAKNTEIARKMIEAALEQGTTQLVLTPHYYGKRRSPLQFIEKRAEVYAHLKPQIPEGIEVRLGAEVHFTGLNLPRFEDLCSLSIEGTECVLFEFPFTEKWHPLLLERLAEFITETDYLPIIAHVERYGEILKNPALVTQLINMGCLLQVNAQAFVDKRSSKLAKKLLEKGLVHCIGSDAHDLEMRSIDLLSARAVIEKAGLAAEWDRTQLIMQEVLSGKKLHFRTNVKIKKLFGFYF